MKNGDFISLIDRLKQGDELYKAEWFSLLAHLTEEQQQELTQQALAVKTCHFGKGIYVRGLIEVSSYCKNNCYYCGLRSSNSHAQRYRLSEADIIKSCSRGYTLGLRTFVLQGGEDCAWTDYAVEQLIKHIHEQWPDAAITLSLGERSLLALERWRLAGASRYLLRHETANAVHYARLHPERMSASHRQQLLFELKHLGYQTGAGMMIGSPFQSVHHLIEDIEFLNRLKPEMIGMGPFIPATHTPFEHYAAGSTELTLRLISLLRLRHRHALIPATTALATLCPTARDKALLGGANVLMPNLSPSSVRTKYSIYNHKAVFGTEAADALTLLEENLTRLGLHIDYGRGDYPGMHNE